MNIMYPLGYIFLFFFYQDVCADKIDQFYQLYESLEKYHQLLIEKFKDRNVSNSLACSPQQIEASIKTTSNFATSCIMLSSISKQPNKLAQGNIVLQAAVAAYAMWSSFFEIIKHKKEQKKLIANMTYVDTVIKFPHIILIEYQLKIIKLLLEMNSSDNLIERAFARIHLVTILLAKPYESISRKLAKTIYKKYFNELGDLISLQEYAEEKIYKKILKAICIDRNALALQSQKILITDSLFIQSEYMYVLKSRINQKMMQMIDAFRNQDIQRLYELKPNILEIRLVELYDYLMKQIDS